MMSLTVLSLPQRYKRLLQAMSIAVAVVYMTLLLYQSAYGYPGMQVSQVLFHFYFSYLPQIVVCMCVGVPPLLRACLLILVNLHLHIYASPSSPLPAPHALAFRFVHFHKSTLATFAAARMRLSVSVFAPLLPLEPFCALANIFKFNSVAVAASAAASAAAFTFCLAYKTVSVFSNFFLSFFLFLLRFIAVGSASPKLSECCNSPHLQLLLLLLVRFLFLLFLLWFCINFSV